MTIQLALQPLLSMIAGILILVQPKLLNYTKRILKIPTLVEWQGRIETKMEILVCV